MSPADIYIIAEIASSHEGDPQLARRLINLAAATGADAVKLQLFRRDTLLSRYHHKYDSFGEIEISSADWTELLRAAAQQDVDVIVEAYDDPSLDLAESTGVVSAYKIPTSDIGNLPFLLRFAATGKRVYLGVGGATDAEVESAVACLQSAGTGDLVLLHGFQSFPTRLDDSNLAWLHELRQRFGVEVGFADHVDAEDMELARMLPAMAIAAGATVIEKHITDDRGRKGRDHHSALNPDEFASLVSLLRRISSAVGSTMAELTDAELAYRHLMKRQAVAARELTAGMPLDATAVAFKRTGQAGLTLEDIERLAGRVLKHNKAMDEPLTEEDLA